MTDHEQGVGGVRPFPVTLDVDRWLLDDRVQEKTAHRILGSG